MANKTSRTQQFNLVLLVLAIFFIISFITNILNSIIVDVKRSFELSLLLTGLLPFFFFIAYGVMSIPAGILSERYSSRLLLILSFLVIAIASFIFVWFPGYLVFGSTLFLMGCSMAVLQVIINPLLRTAGGEANFAFNSVLGQLSFGLASFVSPFLYIFLVKDHQTGIGLWLQQLVPESLPWVSMYVVFGAAAFLFAMVVCFVRFPKIENNPLESQGDRSSYKWLLKNKYTYLFFFGIFSYVGVEQGIGNWISQFLFQYHGLDPQVDGANTVAYFWAMLTIGCLLGLILLKLMDSRRLLIVATILTILSLCVAMYGSSTVSLIAFPMSGFFISVMWSIIFSLGLNSVRSHHGSLSGVLCTGIAGGAIIPLVVGSLADVWGLKTGLWFLLIPLLFILSIGFWANPIIKNNTFRQHRKKTNSA